jgi:hypothetical protein
VQGVEAEANAIQVSGRMVFDQHIGTRNKRAKNLGAGWRCCVEGKALLAGVEV